MESGAIKERLEGAAAQLVAAKAALHSSAAALTAAQGALKESEFSLLSGDRIDGKNEAARKAQLAELTVDERAAVINAEAEERKAQLGVSLAEIEWQLARYLARLFGPAQAG